MLLRANSPSISLFRPIEYQLKRNTRTLQRLKTSPTKRRDRDFPSQQLKSSSRADRGKLSRIDPAPNTLWVVVIAAHNGFKIPSLRRICRLTNERPGCE
jgi:hypothetical protein